MMFFGEKRTICLLLLASRLGFGPFCVHMFIGGFDTERRNFIRRDRKKNTSHKGDRGGMFSKLEGNLLFVIRDSFRIRN